MVAGRSTTIQWKNPTPVGASYITELIDNQAPEGAYGPYAFGLALQAWGAQALWMTAGLVLSASVALLLLRPPAVRR